LPHHNISGATSSITKRDDLRKSRCEPDRSRLDAKTPSMTPGTASGTTQDLGRAMGSQGAPQLQAIEFLTGS
jgi:hypothetical protein